MMLLNKFTRSICVFNLALAGAYFAPLAQANGGHFLVDDATISGPGECLLESWFTREDGETTAVFMPSCGFANGWEFAVPVEVHASDGELLGYGLEAKTIVSERWMNGALAFSMGAMLDHDDQSLQMAFVNLPYSREVSGFGMLHLNLGMEYNHDDRDWEPTWGMASTITLVEGADFIAEVAGAGSDRPTGAVGVRYSLQARLEIDASMARDFEHSANLITLGFNWIF